MAGEAAWRTAFGGVLGNRRVDGALDLRPLRLARQRQAAVGSAVDLLGRGVPPLRPARRPVLRRRLPSLPVGRLSLRPRRHAVRLRAGRLLPGRQRAGDVPERARSAQQSAFGDDLRADHPARFSARIRLRARQRRRVAGDLHPLRSAADCAAAAPGAGAPGAAVRLVPAGRQGNRLHRPSGESRRVFAAGRHRPGSWSAAACRGCLFGAGGWRQDIRVAPGTVRLAARTGDPLGGFRRCSGADPCALCAARRHWHGDHADIRLGVAVQRRPVRRAGAAAVRLPCPAGRGLDAARFLAVVLPPPERCRRCRAARRLDLRRHAVSGPGSESLVLRLAAAVCGDLSERLGLDRLRWRCRCPMRPA